MRAQPVEIVNVRLVVTGKRRATPHERVKLVRERLSRLGYSISMREASPIWP